MASNVENNEGQIAELLAEVQALKQRVVTLELKCQMHEVQALKQRVVTLELKYQMHEVLLACSDDSLRVQTMTILREIQKLEVEVDREATKIQSDSVEVNSILAKSIAAKNRISELQEQGGHDEEIAKLQAEQVAHKARAEVLLKTAEEMNVSNSLRIEKMKLLKAKNEAMRSYCATRLGGPAQ